MSIDRDKLWGIVAREREAFEKAAPEGYGAIVEVTLAGRNGPMVIHRAETLRNPDLPWTLFSVLTKEDNTGAPQAGDSRVVAHDD